MSNEKSLPVIVTVVAFLAIAGSAKGSAQTMPEDGDLGPSASDVGASATDMLPGDPSPVTTEAEIPADPASIQQQNMPVPAEAVRAAIHTDDTLTQIALEAERMRGLAQLLGEVKQYAQQRQQVVADCRTLQAQKALPAGAAEICAEIIATAPPVEVNPASLGIPADAAGLAQAMLPNVAPASGASVTVDNSGSSGPDIRVIRVEMVNGRMEALLEFDGGRDWVTAKSEAGRWKVKEVNFNHVVVEAEDAGSKRLTVGAVR